MQVHHMEDLRVPFDVRKEAARFESHDRAAHSFVSKSYDGYSLTLWSYTTKEAHPIPLL